MIPSGHSIHEQGAFIAEDLRHSINAPIVHDTSIANWSPGDQHWDASQLVINHFAMTKNGYRIRL